MLRNSANRVEEFGKTVAKSVPQPVQLAIGFFLYPLYWASFLYLVTCIPAIGLILGHVAVLKLTGSVFLSVVAIPAVPGFAFFFWVFGTAWSKKIPGMAALLTIIWVAIVLVGGAGLLLGIDLGLFSI